MKLEADIQRLQRRCVVELEQMQQFHRWLDGKRLARLPCRVVGDSRTGVEYQNRFRLSQNRLRG
jgi:hypothetical protein